MTTPHPRADLRDKSKAELEALIAEAQAVLEAKAADPLQPEADRLAVTEHAWDTANDYEGGKRLALAALRRGMELASAPAEPVDFDVEALAHQAQFGEGKSFEATMRSPYEAALWAIQATLNRGARWPVEASSGYERGEWRNGVWHDQTGGEA